MRYQKTTQGALGAVASQIFASIQLDLQAFRDQSISLELYGKSYREYCPKV